MNETMGQIIRKLRKEKNLTQEELAEQLGVTFQAVSKWENDMGMPDISQVVPLCNVLDISSDVLFGIRSSDNNKEIEEFIGTIEKRTCNCPDGISEYENDLYCAKAILEKLKQFPTNYKLLSYSIGHIVCLLDYFDDADTEMTDREKEKRYWRNECIREGNLILRYCNEVEYLNNANRWLANLYAAMGQMDKAEEHAKRLPMNFRFNNRMSMLARIYRDSGKSEEALKQYSKNIYAALQLIDDEVLPQGHLYYKLERYEDAYTCYRLYPDIYRLIAGDRADEMPFCICPCYEHLAKVCMKLGRTEEALDWLTEFVKHQRMVAKNYNVITKSKLPYFYGIELRYSRNTYDRKRKLLPEFGWKIFDPIRETPRFQALLADAEAFEKGE